MSLVLANIPGFVDTPDTAFDSGNPATQDNMQAMNDNAKFGAVRNEQFWGYYKNGEQVVLPVSPADGYNYIRSELLYTWSIFWSGAPPVAALLGTHTTPTGLANSAGGEHLGFSFNVDQSTGNVLCAVSYYVPGGAQTDTADGILMVMTHAQRSR